MTKRSLPRKNFQLSVPSLVTTRPRLVDQDYDNDDDDDDPVAPSPILISSHPRPINDSDSTSSTCSFEPAQQPLSTSKKRLSQITPFSSKRPKFATADDPLLPRSSYFPKNYIDLPYVPPSTRKQQCSFLSCFSPKAHCSLYCPTHILHFKNYQIDIQHSDGSLHLAYNGSLTIQEGIVLPGLIITGKIINNLQSLLVADHNHLVKITNTLYLDTSHHICPFDASNLSKYIQHSSARPNVRIQPFKDQLTSETQFFFVALKPIKQKDFILLDFGEHYTPPPTIVENLTFRI